MVPDVVVLAASRWATNADLIADVARLEYLRPTDTVLDATYGLGTFWRKWQPTQGRLFGLDIDPNKAPHLVADFTNLPFADASVDVVVYDGPYKLNGTPDVKIDQRYGVHVRASWQDRMEMLKLGALECARVARRHLLVKCQAQVVAGEIRWQDRLLADAIEAEGYVLEDRFDLLGKHRPQPMRGRRQKHAHGRPSTLLVLRRVG